MKPHIIKKYIFKCKLAGLPIEFNTEELLNKKIRKLLVDTGIWEKDPLFTQKFWKEYSFKILYPIRLYDEDLDKLPKDWTYLEAGDHHLVCL